MSKLYVMVGVPGSGKSTWAKTHCQEPDVVVSRDEVRFSMVAENEEYFSKENAVFKEFCKQITDNLNAGVNVFADATHINAASRRKLLSNVSGYDEVQAIVIATPYLQTFEQNENRAGTRAFVPRSVIRRMMNQLDFPTFEEGFSQISTIRPDQKIEILIKNGENL